MKIFRKIDLFFRKLSERGLSPLRIEIDRTEAALHRYYSKLKEYDRIWSSDGGLDTHCCHMCAFGQPYEDLLDKIERVEIRLKQLQVRWQKNNSSQ